MGAVGPYPFDRWPRTTRRQASDSTRLAWLLARARVDDARAEATSILRVEPQLGPVSSRLTTTNALAPTVGEDLAISLALTAGGPPALLVAAPGLALVIADRVLGGTGKDLGAVPVTPTRAESGIVTYFVARLLQAARAPFIGVIDAMPAAAALRSLGDVPAIAWATDCSVGDARGLVSLVVPTAAIPLEAPPPAGHLDLSVRAHLDVGEARLRASVLASMEVGDTLVPDALWLDLRRSREGRARLRVARSARTFELTVDAADRWVVARVLSGPLLKPSTRRARTMNDETATLRSLSDVDVEVAIELARVELPIPEVAALAPGVVVTTGRLVGERVALRAGERVLAWGELVDVEGEVGVRITEVAK